MNVICKCVGLSLSLSLSLNRFFQHSSSFIHSLLASLCVYVCLDQNEAHAIHASDNFRCERLRPSKTKEQNHLFVYTIVQNFVILSVCTVEWTAISIVQLLNMPSKFITNILNRNNSVEGYQSTYAFLSIQKHMSIQIAFRKFTREFIDDHPIL